jgi:hypothetical protein
MSKSLIRPAPVYYRSKKVAEIREGTYEIDSNDQREIAAEGYIGHTDGATTSNIQMTLIVPVPGLSIPMLADMLRKAYVKIGLFEDAKLHNLEGRITKISYSWNHEKGENRCVGSFESGAPDLAG